MSWEDILKNQKTFQSLGIGEIDLESSVEQEDDDCVRRLRKMYDNLVKFREEVSDFFTLYASNDSLGTTYFRDSAGEKIIAFNLHWEKNPSNALACEVLEAFDEVNVDDEYYDENDRYYVRKELLQEFSNTNRYQTNITIREPHIRMIVNIYPINEKEYDSATGIFDEYRRAFDV